MRITPSKTLKAERQNLPSKPVEELDPPNMSVQVSFNYSRMQRNHSNSWHLAGLYDIINYNGVSKNTGPHRFGDMVGFFK